MMAMTRALTLETWTDAMRKLLIAAAAAVMALLGCQKNPEAPVSSLTFTSKRPTMETRTGWNGETIEWTAGDAISVAYTVGGQWAGPSLKPSAPLSEGGETAQFTVPGSYDPTLVGAHHFYAVYPAVPLKESSDVEDVYTSVPQIQTPGINTFDPKADLLVGNSVEEYRSLPDYPIPLMWKRLTAHGDITLKNLPLAPGENVRDIVLLAQNGAELTGDIIIDLRNPEEYASAGVPRVTVLADNLSVDASGNLEFWVSVFPVTLTGLTVIVETDQATYYKDYDGLSTTFTQNARNKLGINMADATKMANEQVYVKVTEAPTDWTGDYLIVYEEESKALNGALTTLDAKNNTIAVTIQNGKIQKTATADAARFTIAATSGGYSIRAASGKYIGQNSNDNGLTSSDTELTNTLSFLASDSNVDIVGSKGAHLRFNKQNDQKRFRYYKSSSYSSQEPIQLYKLTGAASGSQPETPTVTTGGSSNVTQSEAILSATYSGKPTYGGVLWGLSADNLSEDWQAPYLNNGAFSVPIVGLGAGHTYYYRAYIGVLENGSYVFYYGDVKSFTTLPDGIVIGNGQPGWYETPMMDFQRSGEYWVNASDPTQYYAIHMCDDSVRGPGGKTARNYVVCYSAEHHCPLWVAAPRHAMYQVKNTDRTDAYRRDPSVPANIQYSSESTGGGCNKGHMLGSEERRCSVETNRDVFYYTNIAPQLSANFNTGGGRWNVLEDYVDTQVCADTLYEVLGCYFDRYTDAYGQTQTPSTISFGGRNDVSMPTMFYYVLLRTKSGNSGKALKDCTADEIKCVAFVRSHVNVRQAVSSRELMSVADLERITGVTYFPNVPNTPKDTFKASDWGL